MDTFDNSPSRQAVQAACAGASVPCLHVGLASGYAGVLWGVVYRVPSMAQDDLCDCPLARNLATLAVAGEVVTDFIVTSERRNLTMTLADLAVHPFAG